MREYPTYISFLLRRSRLAARRKRRGFTLVEVMVVTAIMSVIASIAFPNFVKARTSTRARSCVRQIRTLMGAKEQYALIRRIPTGAVVSMGNLIAEELITSEPVCPDGFPYTVGIVGDDPVCTSGLPGHLLTGPY
jgi:prepilin-type N-terminal cleavage/methylation domain-containing protein